MSWKACAFVKAIHDNITQAEKFVLLLLAEYHNTVKRSSWPSIPQLAEDALMTERNLYNVLRSLEEKNFIKRIARVGRQNDYEIIGVPLNAVSGVTPEARDRGTPEARDRGTPEASFTPPLKSKAPTPENTPENTPEISGSVIRKEPVEPVEPVEPIHLIQNPSLASQEGKEPPSKFLQFREMIFRFYRWKWNQGDPPWDGAEAAQLSRLLKASPLLDLVTFRQWLKNYGDSTDISPGERPCRFLPRMSNYSVMPLNQFGRGIDVATEKHDTLARRNADTIAQVFGRLPAENSALVLEGPRTRGSGDLEKVSFPASLNGD